MISNNVGCQQQVLKPIESSFCTWQKIRTKFICAEEIKKQISETLDLKKAKKRKTWKKATKLENQLKWAIEHRGSVSASHPAALGLIRDVPEIHLILLRLINGAP